MSDQQGAVQVVQPRQRDTEAVVYTWRHNVKLRKYRQVLPGGVTQVIVHPSEEAMLQGWLAWLQAADPDILNVFQASTRLGHLLRPEADPPCPARRMLQGCLCA